MPLSILLGETILEENESQTHIMVEIKDHSGNEFYTSIRHDTSFAVSYHCSYQNDDPRL